MPLVRTHHAVARRPARCWWSSAALGWRSSGWMAVTVDSRHRLALLRRVRPAGPGHRGGDRLRGPGARQPLGPGAVPPAGALRRRHLLRAVPLALARSSSSSTTPAPAWSAGRCSGSGWRCRSRWRSLSFHLLEMPIRRGAPARLAGWAATPLAVGGTAVLVVAATAGAVPGPRQPPPCPLGHDRRGPTPRTRGHRAPTSPPCRPAAPGSRPALLVGDSEASFLGFGTRPGPAASVTSTPETACSDAASCSTTLFHGTLVSQTVGHGAASSRCRAPARRTGGGPTSTPSIPTWCCWPTVSTRFATSARREVDPHRRARLRPARVGRHRAGGARPAVHRGHRGPADRRVLPPARAGRRAPRGPRTTPPGSTPTTPAPRWRGLGRRRGGGTPQRPPRPGGHYAQFVDGVDVRYADGIHVSPAGA